MFECRCLKRSWMCIWLVLMQAINKIFQSTGNKFNFDIIWYVNINILKYAYVHCSIWNSLQLFHRFSLFNQKFADLFFVGKIDIPKKFYASKILCALTHLISIRYTIGPYLKVILMEDNLGSISSIFFFDFSVQLCDAFGKAS